jgi:hypothetical protein
MVFANFAIANCVPNIIAFWGFSNFKIEQAEGCVIGIDYSGNG